MVKLCAILAVGMLACASEETVSPESGDGVTIQQRDESVFDATVTSGGASLHMLVNQVAPDVLDVSFDFGDPVIGFHLDYRAGAGEFQPNGTPLDAAQHHLVDMLITELANVPGLVSARTRVDEVAFRMTNLMQSVPTGEAMASHTFVAQQSWVHISCTCQNQYIGSGYYRVAGRGWSCTGGSGNGCKGRCGASCSPCSGTTAYTQDCAKHDYGLGSWAAASDDFSFATNNCSC